MSAPSTTKDGLPGNEVFYRFKYLLIQQIRKICVKRLEPLRIERRAQNCGDLRGTDRELLPACRSLVIAHA